ncbi:hypothetical protein CDL15_Pgr011228 [Punica granatum]|uniref:Uncharacterized protein n=1 Tax=Punica granatum TaxID=22663 RepID=A0A218WFU3_PUNGR|nr:hypothetical protein CDL15_Pgr011228 [Punica granatum]
MARNNPSRTTDNAPTNTNAAGTSSSKGGGRKVFEVNLISKDEFVKTVTEGFIFAAKDPRFLEPHEKPDQAHPGEIVIGPDQISAGLRFWLH